MHDFYNYAGLHRSVWLYSRPKTHVSDVTVVPGVTGDLSGADITGTVAYEVQVAGVGAEQATVRVRLLDAEGSRSPRARAPRGWSRYLQSIYGNPAKAIGPPFR